MERNKELGEMEKYNIKKRVMKIFKDSTIEEIRQSSFYTCYIYNGYKLDCIDYITKSILEADN